MVKMRLYPAGAMRAAVVVSALAVTACQTTGTNASKKLNEAELRTIPTLEGQRLSGVLPSADTPPPFSGRAGLSVLIVYEEGSLLMRLRLDGESQYAVLETGDVRRTDRFKSATISGRQKGMFGGNVTYDYVFDDMPLREEIWGPDARLKSLRAFEFDAERIVKRSGSEDLDAAIVEILNSFYFDGAMYRLVSFDRNTYVGDRSLVPQDIEGLIAIVENVVIPAVKRGNRGGDQFKYLAYLRQQVSLMSRYKAYYNYKNDMRVRGTWLLDGREYLELGGRYEFSGSLNSENSVEVTGELTTLIDPSTGAYRVSFGTFNQSGRLEGKDANTKMRFRMDFMVPLDAVTVDRPVQPASAGMKSVALALSRGGAGDLLVGRLSFDLNGRSGRLNATVGAVRCEGTWQYFDEPKASWSMTCTDGVAAAGNFSRTGTDAGSGSGVDTNGETVRLTFGGS